MMKTHFLSLRLKVVASLMVGLSFFFSSTALTRELYQGNLSVRALGMGNAYTSVVNDDDSLFYNPAGLGAAEGFNFKLLDPYIVASDPRNFLDVIDSSSEGLADQLAPFFDKSASGGLGTKASFTMPYFAFAAFGDASFSVNLNNPVLPDLELLAIADYGGAVGLAVPVIPKVLDVGMVAKRVIRQGGIIPIDAATISELDVALIEQELQRKGGAFGVDLGVNFKLPGPVDAQFGAVWKNVGQMTFTKIAGSSAPDSEKNQINVGGSVGVDIPLFSALIAMDITHINQSDVQFSKKINLGVEIGLLNFDFRVGLHQGYPTFGLGMSLGLIKFDAAYYGVELGEFAGQAVDNRVAIQITLELGVDPFFDLSSDSTNGKRSRARMGRRPGIKQRR